MPRKIDPVLRKSLRKACRDFDFKKGFKVTRLAKKFGVDKQTVWDNCEDIIGYKLIDLTEKGFSVFQISKFVAIKINTAKDLIAKYKDTKL